MTVLYEGNVYIIAITYPCAIIVIVWIEADTTILFMLLLICNYNQNFFTLSFSTKIKCILRISINLFI